MFDTTLCFNNYKVTPTQGFSQVEKLSCGSMTDEGMSPQGGMNVKTFIFVNYFDDLKSPHPSTFGCHLPHQGEGFGICNLLVITKQPPMSRVKPNRNMKFRTYFERIDLIAYK